MKVALFLHAYQPPTQFPKITQQITQECYRPVIDILLKTPNARITLNFTASLTEQLIELSEDKLLADIQYLVQQGQVEFAATAAYHPLLAKLPEDEILRQIRLNDEINSRAFGRDDFAPTGFFLPEMFYDRHVAEAVAKAGFGWIILDESAYPGAGVEEHGQHFDLEISRNLYRINRLPLNVFFRNRPLSLEFAFNANLSINQVVSKLQEYYLDAQESYALIAGDMETFGHHIKTNLGLVSDLMGHPRVEPVSVSELLTLDISTQEIEPLESTWGMAIEDVRGERSFPRWDNPDNPIHKLQWELYSLVLRVSEHDEFKADLLDKALHSDQFWWASHNPCWHLEMVNRATQMLKTVVLKSSKANAEMKQQAVFLSERIFQIGKELFGEEVVGC